MDVDRINAQAQTGNPAETTEANDPQARGRARMLRGLEYCFAENVRAELAESHDHADEETISANMRREYNLSDEILDHFYEAAQSIGAIQRTPRADGITLSAVTGYEPITRPESREANAATERGDQPVSYAPARVSAGANRTPAVLFPESTKPANLCHDPAPTIRSVEHTAKSNKRKDETDIWREEHSQRRRANLRIIARTADWSRQSTDFHADSLAAIRDKIEAQVESGQARRNAARAEANRRRKPQHSEQRDLPQEDDGYKIPGCGHAADEEEDDNNEQGFVPSVLEGMAAASYTEVWDA
jgi:hypothetical protein